MPSTTKPDARTIDAKALAAAIGKGHKLMNTPKVRAGFKAGEQKLVQANGKTLGMLTLREGKGVRVEGNRLAKNVTVTDAKGVTEARKLLAAVEQENTRKAKAAEAKKTTQPQARPSGGKSSTAKRVEAAAAKAAKPAEPQPAPALQK